MRAAVAVVAAIAALTASGATSGEEQLRVREYAVPSGTHPHDVAPARDGGVWYHRPAHGPARLARPEDR